MGSVLVQLFRFMKVYRKFWLAPILFGLVGLGVIRRRAGVGDRSIHLCNILR